MNRPKTETSKQVETLVEDGDAMKDVSFTEGVGTMGLVIKGGVAGIERRS